MTTQELINRLAAIGIITSSGRISQAYKRILQREPIVESQIYNATDFVQYDAPIIVRIKMIQMLIDHQPTCKVCGAALKMATSGPRLYTFPEFCGSKCFSGTSETKRRRAKTNYERYDSEYAINSEYVRTKVKATLIDRYGVDNGLKSPEIRAKVKETIKKKYVSEAAFSKHVAEQRESSIVKKYGSRKNFNAVTTASRVATIQRKYGVDNVFELAEMQDKAKKTMIERHGVEHAIQSPEIHEKFKQTMIERYGVEHALRNNQSKSVFRQTSIDRYGVEYPMMSPDIAAKATANSRAMLQERYGVDYPSLVNTNPQSIALLNDAEWFKDQYIVQQKSMIKMAKELGVAHSTVMLYAKKHQIDVVSRTTSQFEREIVDYIKEISNTPIVTSDRSILKPYELDIFFPHLDVAIECDGVYWHGELRGKGKQYHLTKTDGCNARGIRLIHIRDYEWENKHDIVKSRLRNLVGLSSRVYARKCTIVEVTPKQASEFFNTNHIQGHANGNCYYGLQYNNEIVAMLSMVKSRYNKNYQWELLRYANKLDTSVVGGASRLFQHFIKIANPQSIITYSDRRWNTGNMYKQLGFTHIHDAAPNYLYFKPPNVWDLYSRVQFQKHKLADKLDKFDPELTEWENMQLNGYDRIWDCGNSVWHWSN